jgi:hypothetical protein
LQIFIGKEIKIMSKIRLTESQLHRVINESMDQIIREEFEGENNRLGAMFGDLIDVLYEINQDPENASQLIQKALAVIGKMAEKTGVRLNGNGTFMNLYNQSF